MSEMFQSFKELSWDHDDRLLERQSPRSVLLCLLISVFMLGVGVAIFLIRSVRLHHYDWADLIPFLALGLVSFRCVRALYRNLGKN